MYVRYGHRSSAANFKFTDHLFTENFFCSLKLMSSRRSIMKTCMKCWTDSVLLEACEFVKTIPSLMSRFTRTKAYTAGTI